MMCYYFSLYYFRHIIISNALLFLIICHYFLWVIIFRMLLFPAHHYFLHVIISSILLFLMHHYYFCHIVIIFSVVFFIEDWYSYTSLFLTRYYFSFIIIFHALLFLTKGFKNMLTPRRLRVIISRTSLFLAYIFKQLNIFINLITIWSFYNSIISSFNNFYETIFFIWKKFI